MTQPPQGLTMPLVNRRRLWLAIAALMLAELLSAFEASMVYVSLPAISADVGSIEKVGWLVTAFVIMQSGTAAVAGRLGDIFGRRRVLVFVLALCAAGSAISAFHDDFAWIIVGRALQGASGAVMPLSYGIVREVSPESEAPFWVGVLSATLAGGAAIAFLMGGWIVQNYDWHAIFYVTVALPLLTIPVILSFVPAGPTTPPEGKVDLVGGLLFVPAVIGVLLALGNGSRLGWTSPAFLASLGASLVLLVFWAAYELRHAHPLFDIRLLLNRQILLANGVIVLYATGHMQISLVSMMLLQQKGGPGIGLSATEAAVFNLPSMIGGALAATGSGWLAARYNPRLATIIGAAALTFGWSYMALFHASVWQVGIGMVLVSIAGGFLMSSVPNLVLEAAPIERSSELTGMTFVVRGIFMGIGAQVVVALLAAVGLPDSVSGRIVPSDDAYLLAFSFIAALNFIMIFGALALPRSPR